MSSTHTILNNESTRRRALAFGGLGALGALTLAAAALTVVACSEPAVTAAPAPAAGSAVAGMPGTHIQYGTPVQVGNGRARSYVVLDQKSGGAPLEVGVAFDSVALDGLPAPMPMPPGGAMGHADMHEYRLAMPAQNPTPFRFVELDWNPAGHEPDHVYTLPHFDFHFYTISVEERNAILPSDPQYATKAGNFPGADYVPAGYVAGNVLVGAPPEAAAVPRMGMHWISPATSPELPPTLARFTQTFIYGTWDGAFIFAEPMVTREFILSKPNVTTAIARAAKHAQPGWWPSAYQVKYDERSREYRVALSGFANVD